MHIRKSTKADGEKVGDVDVQAFTNSEYGRVHNLPNDAAARQARWHVAKEWCEQHPDWVYVAVVDDKIVGFVAFGYDVQRGARIENSAVLPAYTNRGISTQLVRSTLEELQRLGAKCAWVGTEHVPAARRVYEKAGFILTMLKGATYWYDIQFDQAPDDTARSS